MYAFIEGKIVEKNPAFIIMQTGGIGYYIHITLSTFTKIKDKEEFRILVHHAIKSDAAKPIGFALYGFAEEQELLLFRQLISVSGVGYNTALLILSSLSGSQLFEAITQGNTSVLESVKGIGKKSAQRIIIDLKDKLGKAEIVGDFKFETHNTRREEALSGLSVLGFNKLQSEKAINSIFSKHGDNLEIEEIIKLALQIL